MVDTSSAGPLDRHECPICGLEQLVAVDGGANEHPADRVCLACESALFVDPVLVGTSWLRSESATAIHSARASAA